MLSNTGSGSETPKNKNDKVVDPIGLAREWMAIIQKNNNGIAWPIQDCIDKVKSEVDMLVHYTKKNYDQDELLKKMQSILEGLNLIAQENA
jgi:hypothetical protein